MKLGCCREQSRQDGGCDICPLGTVFHSISDADQRLLEEVTSENSSGAEHVMEGEGRATDSKEEGAP